MAKRPYGWSEKKIAGYLADGRGQGVGAEYRPFITIHDLSSKGRSSRLVGSTTGRIHHFFSDNERAVALEFDWDESVFDIREQFPLDRRKTVPIAEAMDVPHPRADGIDIVMTTDLLVDYRRAGASRQVAVSVKYSDDLDDDRTLEKLEIERRYWAALSVPYRLVTEKEVSKVRTHMLIWLQEYRSLEGLDVPYPGYWEERCDLVQAALSAGPHGTVAGLFRDMERDRGWTTGDALAALRHLAANRRVLIDIDRPFDVRGPLSQIVLPGRRASGKAA